MAIGTASVGCGTASEGYGKAMLAVCKCIHMTGTDCW